jgi:hypothetical protein
MTRLGPRFARQAKPVLTMIIANNALSCQLVGESGENAPTAGNDTIRRPLISNSVVLMARCPR